MYFEFKMISSGKQSFGGPNNLLQVMGDASCAKLNVCTLSQILISQLFYTQKENIIENIGSFSFLFPLTGNWKKVGIQYGSISIKSRFGVSIKTYNPQTVDVPTIIPYLIDTKHWKPRNMSGTRTSLPSASLSLSGCQSPKETPFVNTMSTLIYLTFLTLMFTVYVYSNPTGRLASLKSSNQ